jgi:CBS domain-containing protein
MVVLEHGGEHRRQLDIKRAGLLPIVDLARWAAMTAGITSASTIERLRAAGDAGTLAAAEAETLEEAHELFLGLRVDHQVAQLRDGRDVDDRLDPRALGALTRRRLKDAFRAVASIQRRVAAELHLPPLWPGAG